MPEPATVHLIVFSKDRPLQLHGMLSSVFRHWRGSFKVDVLVRAEGAYGRAYREIGQEFSGVAWSWEEDFAADLSRVLALDGHPSPYTCFGCDDVVYVAPVDVPTVAGLFANPGLLGVSLRLGKNIVTDMFWRTQRQPFFLHQGTYDPVGNSEQWPFWTVDADGAVGDWAYPWEVLGTVYRTEFVRRMVSSLPFSNPSTLEHNGSLEWRRYAAARSLLCAYPRSRLVVPTVNVVQQVFGNGIVGPGPGMPPEFLLDCWHQGMRLDAGRYRGMAPPSWRIGDLYLKAGGAAA